MTLPAPYKSMDTNRLTLLYFCISGLDLLDMLGEVDTQSIVEYIYSLQAPLLDHGGFYGYPPVQFERKEQDTCNNQPHIANTYVALIMLLILGDDLQRVQREGIAASLRKWQLEDGSFCCVHGISSLDSENDIRFTFCAAAICYVLDLWHVLDVDRMHQNIMAARSYDSAFGMGFQTESHGGCTYCALASLSMMGRLDDLPERVQLVDWLVKRQQEGLQGRVGKDPDSCYSFWVGASLKLLGVQHFLDDVACSSFIKRCEFQNFGGFQKFPDVPPDLLHSYFSVAGLSLCGLLTPLDARLNMSQRALDAARGGEFVCAHGTRKARLAPKASAIGRIPALFSPATIALVSTLALAVAFLRRRSTEQP